MAKVDWKIVPAGYVEGHLEIKYPNAPSTPLFDTDYALHPNAYEYGQKLYKGFWRWMTLMGLLNWVFNKMDCDKRSWLFRSYVIAVIGLRRDVFHSIPFLFINYYINGTPGSGHSINALLGQDQLVEIDPKPIGEGGGIIKLSKAERDSVFLRLV
jgi:hypothetical protein